MATEISNAHNTPVQAGKMGCSIRTMKTDLYYTVQDINWLKNNTANTAN